ncbi:MAG TPA: diadenylate cyclase CdaA [Prolixibacteraceae bacterium]|nr:diadenylate cyclase CdaA [Prolixibacteraceae bacterium]
MTLFITIRVLDVIDILLVAFLLYQMYRLIKGTVAFSIFIGFFLVYVAWLVVKAMNLELLGTLMGQFIGVGVLALIVVFQQEIRRFLLLIGTNYQLSHSFGLEKLFATGKIKPATNQQIKEIVRACDNLARSKTGALIVVVHVNSELKEIIRSGEKMNSRISSALLETIFFKNTPLHDGAVVVVGNRIAAARCILPLSERQDINPHLGLRHRAAIGLSEVTDAMVIAVSEEKGTISLAIHGQLMHKMSLVQLTTELEKVIVEES